jgi:hypothetical protein
MGNLFVRLATNQQSEDFVFAGCKARMKQTQAGDPVVLFLRFPVATKRGLDRRQ